MAVPVGNCGPGRRGATENIIPCAKTAAVGADRIRELPHTNNSRTRCAPTAEIFDDGTGLRDHARMKANQRQNQLRIIGGSWRGRKLPFAALPGLRPTPDRVRETLFNWLAPVIGGARCLDLYAGSGALGLEAASRGAAEVVLVDQAEQVIAVLREQVNILEATQVQLVQGNVLRWLCGTAEPFDIVFLDPPFGQQLLPESMRLLEENGWLAPDAFIYIEMEKGLQPELPQHWEVYRSKQAGQVGYSLIRRCVMP